MSFPNTNTSGNTWSTDTIHDSGALNDRDIDFGSSPTATDSTNDYSQQRSSQPGFTGTSDTNTYAAGGGFGSAGVTSTQPPRGQDEFSSGTTATNSFGASSDFSDTNARQRGNHSDGPGAPRTGGQSEFSGTTDPNTFGSGGGGGGFADSTRSNQHSGLRNDGLGEQHMRTQDERAGSTTDTGTSGGNSHEGGHRAGHQDSHQRDLRNDGPGEDASEREDSNGQRNKPSVGARVKGTLEQVAGSVTGNHGLQERGKERKQGEFDQNF